MVSIYILASVSLIENGNLKPINGIEMTFPRLIYPREPGKKCAHLLFLVAQMDDSLAKMEKLW